MALPSPTEDSTTVYELPEKHNVPLLLRRHFEPWQGQRQAMGATPDLSVRGVVWRVLCQRTK